jgi:hypothetical protein
MTMKLPHASRQSSQSFALRDSSPHPSRQFGDLTDGAECRRTIPFVPQLLLNITDAFKHHRDQPPCLLPALSQAFQGLYVRES